MVKAMIHSEKRIVQITLGNITGGAVGGLELVIAKQDPTASAPQDVEIGTTVKAIYLELWLLGTGQQPNTSSVIVEKIQNSAGTAAVADMQNLNGYANKRNILEMHQGLIGDANTNPTPFYRNWIKIPKGKQRFALGDSLSFIIHAITEDIQFCGVAIFKAYN